MTTSTGRSTVVGVFHEREQARRAIEGLKDAGFNPDAISVLSPDRREGESLSSETGTHEGSHAVTGAVAGGVLGGLGGWLLGIGALAIPGIGPFIAAGAFASALGGAAIGAGVGAIAGALTGMGVPQEEAEYYEGEVKGGRTLVTVNAPGRYDEAQRILRQYGAYDIETRGGSTGTDVGLEGAGARPMTTGTSVEGGQRIQLREEELQARKQSVEAGAVELRKDVVSESQTLQVPVTHEEVVIERRAVEGRPSNAPIGEGQTISVPLREEQVTAEKRPVVYEEVEVGKRAVQETQQVSDTVRREELRVEKEGDVTMREGGANPGERRL